MQRHLTIAGLLASLTLAACSSTNPAAPALPNITAPAAANDRLDDFTRAQIAAMGPIGHAVSGAPKPPNPSDAMAPRIEPDATTQLNHTEKREKQQRDSNGGQYHITEGFYTNPNDNGTVGDYANMTVYSNFMVPGYTIYAPNMNSSGATAGNCAEVGVSYTGSTPAFFVFDDCNNTGFFFKNVDATFLNNYVRTLGSSKLPELATVSESFNSNASSPTWYVFLYNFANNAWDQIDSITGATDSAVSGGPGQGFGWFEEYAPNGTNGAKCIQVPTIEMGMWQVASAPNNFTSVSPSITSPINYANCFNASQPDHYTFTTISPNYDWQVTGGA